MFIFFIFRLFALTLLLSGCAAPYDYAEDTDFRAFTSVALAPSGDVHSLDGARIGAAAKAMLPARGLRLTTPDQASLWLHYRLLQETRLLTTTPSMFSRHGNLWDDEERVYGAVRQQRLELWLTQAHSGRVLWRSKHPRAFPADNIKGMERRRRIEQQVAELLRNYPPRP
ncbi:hypothetical protein HNR62_002602 [Oceanisphaera litoralis]|uniref:DUF4136 domain-containing protein n=1 Tax=Oceanisphaera litoralis TaxID=225144 RepID=UPI001EF89A1A|nr:DUF4136 domain-containing protein [Oceanisphaera litoralis]MBM7456704.1 hypothetical protein [Oceanisphaera litoralis]